MLEKTYKEQQLDVLSALSLAEYALNGKIFLFTSFVITLYKKQ